MPRFVKVLIEHRIGCASDGHLYAGVCTWIMRFESSVLTGFTADIISNA